jgi:hypothetical protein
MRAIFGKSRCCRLKHGAGAVIPVRQRMKTAAQNLQSLGKAAARRNASHASCQRIERINYVLRLFLPSL